MKNSLTIRIIRELSKVWVFTLAWGSPMYISKCTGNYSYLWLFALSLIVITGIFTHYEDLENNNLKDDKHEQENV